jgi:hypothetical protein
MAQREVGAVSATGRDGISDDELDRQIRSADSRLASELERVVNLREGLEAVELAAGAADTGRSATDTWATVSLFPLPVPDSPAALAAADPAQGSASVVRATSPDGLASFILYERGDGEYWLEVSPAPAAPAPRVVLVRYTEAGGGQRELLIPVDGAGDTPTAVVRLPGYLPGSWHAAGPVPPADVPAWDSDMIAASVDAAVTSATVRAWQRLASVVPDGVRQVIVDALGEDAV